MKRLRSTFDRVANHSGSWHLAISLACPVCGARLRGNMKHAWCDAWHCSFWCDWDELDTLAFKFNKHHTSEYLEANKFCLKFKGIPCSREDRVKP